MTNKDYFSIKETSEYLGISPATVHNWLKLGKLNGLRSGGTFIISSKEVIALANNLDNMDLLKSRRNKTRQSTNFIPRSYINPSSPNMKSLISIIEDAEALDFDALNLIGCYAGLFMNRAGLPDFVAKELSLLSKESDRLLNFVSCHPLEIVPNEDTLGMLYLSLKSLQSKKASGSYYTPYFVVDHMISSIDSFKGDVLDPSCGSGNFLIRLPQSVPLENIYGTDIDEAAIKIARINLAIRFKVDAKDKLDTLLKNIRCENYLFSSSDKKYDLIIGNPPWGYVFDALEIARIKKLFSSYEGGKRPESYDLFIEKSLLSIPENGLISLLLPETILETNTHTPIRKIILRKHSLSSLTYLGDIFDKVQCPCVVMNLSSNKTAGNCKCSFFKKKYEKKSYLLKESRQFEVPSERISIENFNILSDNQEYEVLCQIKNNDHFTLLGKADFALGIVTGSNSTMLKSIAIDGYEGILKGNEIHKFYHDQPVSFIKFSPENFQQVAPENLYRAKEKLFYRFISDNLCFTYDDTGLLSLNSANILIPKVDGYSALYIMAVLNSAIMSFYYRHSFKSIKVLRSSIEQLPIATCSTEKMQEISSIAYNLTKNDNNFDEMVKELDKEIARLYGFSEKDLVYFYDLK